MRRHRSSPFWKGFGFAPPLEEQLPGNTTSGTWTRPGDLSTREKRAYKAAGETKPLRPKPNARSKFGQAIQIFMPRRAICCRHGF